MRAKALSLQKVIAFTLLPVLPPMNLQLYCTPLKKKLGLGDNKPQTKENCYEAKKMGSQSQG